VTINLPHYRRRFFFKFELPLSTKNFQSGFSDQVQNFEKKALARSLAGRVWILLKLEVLDHFQGVNSELLELGVRN
jgi:hypothetical protein